MEFSNSNKQKWTISKGSYGSDITLNCITTESINDITKPFVITDKKNIIKDKRRFRKTWKLK